jgi:hypothetical protein
MKEIFKMDLNKETGHFYGLMEADMMDNFTTIIYKASDIISGQMDDNIKVYGKIIKCMAKEYLLGQMVEYIKDNI